MKKAILLSVFLISCSLFIGLFTWSCNRPVNHDSKSGVPLTTPTRVPERGSSKEPSEQPGRRPILDDRAYYSASYSYSHCQSGHRPPGISIAVSFIRRTQYYSLEDMT